MKAHKYRMLCSIRALSVAVAGTMMLAVPMPALAQQQVGTVVGRVVDVSSQQPLSGVQVYLAVGEAGTLTGPNGRYLLTNVPAGTHQIRFELLGYRRQDAEVTVRPNESIELNMELRVEALALDAIVVTGTAGGTQRRAVGNVVERMDVSELVEITPAQSVTQLIGQRTPGVIQLGATGAVGSGTRIRIRGAQSMGLGNDPLVYIDGIRMDSRPTAGPGQRGGANITRINDINPQDIESIEIIKGPAAATLYGTEASNGVIQIITKRGSTGAPRFDVTVRTGTHWLWNPAGRQGLTWARDPQGVLHSYNVYEYERQFGTGDIFTYGFLQSYQANLTGGTDQLRYFLSGSWSDDTGVRPENWDQKANLRANLDLTLSDKLGITTSLGYVRGETRTAYGGFNDDPFSNIYWASPLPSRVEYNRGFFRAPPEEWGKIDNRSNIGRFMTSVTLNYRPWERFAHRLVVGMDINQERNSSLTPKQAEGRNHYFGTAALGTRAVTEHSREFATLDYSGSLTTHLSDRFSSVSSYGFQYYRNSRLSIGSSGNELPAPQVTTVSAAAVRAGTETFEENATVGVYLQQQIGWQNRVFFTAAVRADDNSAFGTEFDAAIYPKVSATWVVHEEPFWNLPWLSQFRLRAAWGAAGQQPGTFDATQLLSPQIGHGDSPGLVPSSFGNPKLKPERGEELEAGFDAEFLDGRLSLVYTRFQRNTKDAIVSAPLPRSLGWPGSQIVNLGRVKGWGNELALDFRVMERRGFVWELGTQLSDYHNEILSLGPGVNSIGNHYVGYSIQDMYWVTVVDATIDANGALLEAWCDGGTGPLGVDRGGPRVPCTEAGRVRWGHTQPTWDIGVNSTWSLGAFRLYARVDALGGHYTADSSSPANITSNILTYLSNMRTDPLVEAYRRYGRQPMGTYEGGFARLREVSAQYVLPEALAGRLRAARGSVTLAVNNVTMLWTAQHGWNTRRDGRIDMKIGDGHVWDVEGRARADLSIERQTVMPPLASANLTVRLSF